MPNDSQPAGPAPAMQRCLHCQELRPARQILDPPLLRVARAELPRIDDNTVDLFWQPPNDTRSGGPELFILVQVDSDYGYIRPWEVKTYPICSRCWLYGIWPALYPYLCNKPDQLQLNGWQDPTWED